MCVRVCIEYMCNVCMWMSFSQYICNVLVSASAVLRSVLDDDNTGNAAKHAFIIKFRGVDRSA